MAYFRQRGCVCTNKKRCKCGAKWSFTLDVGIDPVTGKRKQKTVSGFDSEKDARKACAALETDVDRGNLSLSNNRTLANFMHHCLTHIIVHEVSEATLDGKWSIYNNYIEPEKWIIGNKFLHKLTADDLQVFYNSLILIGLSPGGIANVSRLLNQTLRIAMERDYIVRNVNKLVKKPAYKQKKIIVWSKEQFDHFLVVSEDSYLYPYYLIALNTGIRPGEMYATSWDHIDFVKMQINIDSTITRTKGKGIHIKPSPKNDASVRSISLPSHVVAYLKRYKLEQFPNTLNLVVPGLESDMLYANTANKIFKEDCKRAGLPYISLHGLRHTHATYLLSPPPYGLGISVKAVSERLGHSKTTTTLNTYFSVLPNMQEGIAEKLEIHAQKPVDKSI